MNIQLIVDGAAVALDHEDLAAIAWNLSEREDASEVLTRLAEHPHEAVRANVARSDHLPREAHRKLAASSSDSVAEAALSSRHAADLDDDLMLVLAKRPYDVARSMVHLIDRMQPETREALLPVLMSHADPAVRALVVSELSPRELRHFRARLLGDADGAVVRAVQGRIHDEEFSKL